MNAYDLTLEFYFENKLIMGGPAEEFIRMDLFESDDKDKKVTKVEDILFQLGDRFNIDDFPKEGNSMTVRVIKMDIGEKFKDGDYIKYYLEEYKSQ